VSRAGVADESPDATAGLLASTAAVTAGNLVSRVTGFLRVLSVGLALGTTFAGNTYQTSNLVSNVLFELLAAGLLSSVLVPPFVRLLDRGRREDAERLAGTVLGLALAALGAVTVVGLVARVWIIRLLTLAVADPAVRRQEVELGSFLLLFLLPQVLLYAVGSIATGLLYGQRRFAAAAFAPVANNVLVIATMVVFWAMQHAAGGGRPGLVMPTPERLVLGLGTTGGVLAMTLVPVVALWRSGVRLRPRWELAQPGLRRLGRDGLWAAGMLACNQLLVVTTLVLANRVEGGVVAYHIAFQVFLLPFALLAHPVMTALYPRLASAAHQDRWRTFGEQLRGGAGAMAFLALPASALLVALAGPALRLLRLGNLDAAGTVLVSRLVVAYGVGLLGYAGFQLLVRAFYAEGDTRTPTVVAAGVAAGGSLAMVVWFVMTSGAGRLAAVGFGHTLGYLGGGLVLAVALARRVAARTGSRVGEPAPRFAGGLARTAGCAAVAGGAAFLVGHAIGGGRLATASAVAAGAAAGLSVYVGAQRLLGASELDWLRGRSGASAPAADPAPTPVEAGG
jgi:putative peptidoglycan lipid II flippase